MKTNKQDIRTLSIIKMFSILSWNRVQNEIKIEYIKDKKKFVFALSNAKRLNPIKKQIRKYNI